MNTLAQRGLLDSLATERISHAVLEPGKAMKKISLEPMVIAQPAPVAGAPLAEVGTPTCRIHCPRARKLPHFG